MFAKGQHFPWRVYMRFVLSQVAFLTLIFALHALTLYLILRELGEIIGEILLFAGFVSLAFSTVFSFWIGRRFFLPLGRLILQARSLHTRKLARQPETSSDSEEWQQLGEVIEAIEKDLRTASDRLSRGRHEIKTLMNAISEAILAVDTTGQSFFYNDQFLHRFAGHPWGESPRLQQIFRSPAILESFAKAISTGTTVSVTTQVPGTGEMADYYLSVSPLKVRESGEIYGALGIFHDISELKKAERIRIEFVGNASHELRTPLTSIKGYVETLREDFQKGRYEGADKFLTVIARNVDRMIALVGDLLDLSSLEGAGHLNAEWVNTREITEGVLKSLKQRATGQQVIDCAYEADRIWGDARKLEQVLINLVHNAIKYIPQDKKIEIQWRRDEDGTELLVQDNGPGIGREHLPRLFERFYRVDEGRARGAGGTGLGLAIVKHICLRHGGWAKVESEIGFGTAFTCFFPDPSRPTD